MDHSGWPRSFLGEIRISFEPPSLGASYSGASPTQNAGKLLYAKFCRWSFTNSTRRSGCAAASRRCSSRKPA